MRSGFYSMRIQKRQTKEAAGSYAIITVAAMKEHLLIDSDVTDQDDVIQDYIDAATGFFQDSLDYSIDTDEEIYQFYDGFDSQLPIFHRFILSADADIEVSYWDGSEWQVVDSSLYIIDSASAFPRIILRADSSWPDVEETMNNVSVTFFMDTASGMLKNIKGGIIAWVTARYENREAQNEAKIQAVIDACKITT